MDSGARDEISEVSLRVMRETEWGQRRGYRVGGTRSDFCNEFGSRDRPREGGRAPPPSLFFGDQEGQIGSLFGHAEEIILAISEED